MAGRVAGLGYYRRLALYLTVAFLFVTSFLLPETSGSIQGGGLSVFAGHRHLQLISGLSFCLLLLVSVYLTSEPVVPRYQDRIMALALSAAMIFACPDATSGSLIHLAAIALLWAQFCLLKEAYFLAFFLMAISSMFFPPVLWMALLVVVLMLLAGLTDPLRNLLKFFGGLAVPYILFFGISFVLVKDIVACKANLNLIWLKMTDVGTGFFSAYIPTLFLVLCVVFMCLHASMLFMSRMWEFGISESYSLKVQIINVVVCTSAFFLFSSSPSPVVLLACCPSAVLLAKYFSRYGSSSFLKVEFIILLSALVISRLGKFIV